MASLEYHPSVHHASQFWEEHSRKESSAPQVPDGFPEQLTSSLAWTRAEIESQRSKWIVNLDEDDVKAIEVALAAFEGEKHRGIYPQDLQSALTCMIKLNPSIYHRSLLRLSTYRRLLLSV